MIAYIQPEDLTHRSQAACKQISSSFQNWSSSSFHTKSGSLNVHSQQESCH